MDEVVVSSWNELQDRLFEDSWQASLRRFRSHFAFRGMPDVLDDLRTGLARLGGAYERQETHLVRNFRKYAAADSMDAQSLWHWLAAGQHHGLPTRLLDWTYSPFVALHFATDRVEDFHLDGVVWQVDYRRTNRHIPRPLAEALAAEGSDVFTAEMLAARAPSLADLDALAPDVFAIFLEPPSLDDRIVNQFALFSLMSSPCARLDEWLAQRPGCARRIVIPSSLKWEVRDKLDQANITERVLFPGLDGLCRWLRRYYLPHDGVGLDADARMSTPGERASHLDLPGRANA